MIKFLTKIEVGVKVKIRVKIIAQKLVKIKLYNKLLLLSNKKSLDILSTLLLAKSIKVKF